MSRTPTRTTETVRPPSNRSWKRSKTSIEAPPSGDDHDRRDPSSCLMRKHLRGKAPKDTAIPCA